MKLTDPLIQTRYSFQLLFSLMLVCSMQACAPLKTVSPGKSSVPTPRTSVEPEPRFEEDEDVVSDTETVQPTAPPEVEQPMSVAIVLSSDLDVYRELADYLLRELDDRAKLFVLSGRSDQDRKLLDGLQLSDRDQIVAVGLRAAQAVSGLEQKQVYFCYVFNYRDHNLTNDHVKGVSALPGSTGLFRDWKTLSPTTRKVAVITGPLLDEYMSAARLAAKSQNIELVHIIVHTDKEFLYQTKYLDSDIQGMWIIPDNRVLSRKTLKEALTYNSKEGKQTVVFSPSLLKLGGLFYSRISPEEVSDKIMARLRDGQHRGTIPGADVELLDEHEIGINPVVAKQLGLTIPENYKKYIDE